MVFWENNGAHRIAVFAVVAAALLLLWCEASSMLPRARDANAGFQSYAQFARAYARISAGSTPVSELARIGFDDRAAGAEVLSYFGAVERFMPHDSVGFDALDPAMRNCLEARDRCTAYIFRMAGWQKRPDGNATGLFFDRAGAAPEPRLQVTLLIRDGRIVYKAVSGMAAGSEPLQESQTGVIDAR